MFLILYPQGKEVTQMKKLLKLLKGEEGATATEYAVMLALIIVVCVFRGNPDTRSGRFRTPIPFDSGQSFLSIPDTL